MKTMKEPFRRLAEKYSDRIFTFAWYSLRNREEAEDVTQEVLVKLWQHVEEIEPGKLTAWVLKVTRNAVIDVSRRSRAKAAVFAEGLEFESVPAASAGRVLDPEEALRASELRTEFEAALAALDDPYRSIVIMREIQGLSYADIARGLDLPLNTVKVYLHRGRLLLRKALKGMV